MIRECCVLDTSNIKCTNECIGNSKHCKEHIGKCCAKGENDNRCTNDCIGDSKHCLEHISKSKKLYLKYKGLSEYVKTIDVNKPFDDINEQVNYLLKYYDVLHKTYSARTKHREYAIAPECYDVGHNRQFIILQKKINYCEKLLKDFNINVDNIPKPYNLIKSKNTFDKLKMYKSQFFNPRDKLHVNNFVKNTFNNKTYVIKTTNDTKKIINPIINDTKEICEQTIIDTKEINHELINKETLLKNNKKITKIKNKSLRAIMKKVILTDKAKENNKGKPIKKKKNKKKFEPVMQMDQIKIKKDISEEEDENIDFGHEFEYENEDETFEDSDELEYFRQLIEDKLTDLILQMFGSQSNDNEFILFLTAIKLINRLSDPDINYFVPKFKAQKKRCGCFKFFDLPLSCKCSCMDGVDTISKYCDKFEYGRLVQIYNQLSAYNGKIDPLIKDIKKLYMVFEDQIIDLPVRLVWSVNENRLVVEQKGYSPNQHIH